LQSPSNARFQYFGGRLGRDGGASGLKGSLEPVSPIPLAPILFIEEIASSARHFSVAEAR
jgi:hypothetical protein